MEWPANRRRAGPPENRGQARGLAVIRGREWVAGVEQSIGLVKVSVTLPWRAGGCAGGA